MIAILHENIYAMGCKRCRYLAQLAGPLLFELTDHRPAQLADIKTVLLQYHFRPYALFHQKVGMPFIIVGKDTTTLKTNTVTAQRFAQFRQLTRQVLSTT